MNIGGNLLVRPSLEHAAYATMRMAVVKTRSLRMSPLSPRSYVGNRLPQVRTDEVRHFSARRQASWPRS